MKTIYLIIALFIFIPLTHAQTLEDKAKLPGSIDLQTIDIKVDFSDYIRIPTRHTGDDDFKFTTMDYDVFNDDGIVVTSCDKDGNPTFLRGDIARIPGSFNHTEIGEAVLGHLRKLTRNGELNLSQYGIEVSELRKVKTRKGQNGRTHIEYRQYIEEIPVYAGEIRMHLYKGKIYAINGRMYKAVEPQDAAISQGEALNLAYASVHARKPVAPRQFTPEDKVILMYFSPGESIDLRLAYKVDIHPAFNKSWEIFIDAINGDVLRRLSTICTLDGPATAVAEDLNGINRTIHTYEINGTYYMLDGSRPMFNSSSDLLNNPVGAIWTIDGNSGYPGNSDFQVSHITSPNNNWNNRKAVSAHFNAATSYEYYKNTFNRNSIDGSGSTIISIINITEEDGTPMDNAFWNGRAMFYGNGDEIFKPLAGALDVAAHELTHGVTQSTANLEYQNESGAINESMSDVFGVLVDRDDWLLGEDVIKSGFGAPALRNMKNPHQGGSQLGEPGYQPAHYSERYTGSLDNGGVHINSGIPNRAFYLFATAVGKAKAEQVYYSILTNYLGVRSDFSDLRAAVVQACLDLYGQEEMEAAVNAFSTVGIGGGGNAGGDDPNTYPDNPGNDWVYVVNTAGNLELYDASGNFYGVLNSTVFVKSKPSVTDNGRIVVYVTQDGRIYYHILDFSGSQPAIVDEGVMLDNDDGEWGNVTISDDGRYVAFVSNFSDKTIFAFDFVKSEAHSFELYNPTHSDGVKTGGVQYADALDFHHNGQYVVYDAYNEIEKSTGENITYWNVGIIRISDGNTWATGDIQLVLGSLPEGVSIGNPSFSNNTDAYLAIDIIENNGFTTDYSVGILHFYENAGYVLASNTGLSFPDFSSNDRKLILSSQSNLDAPIIVEATLASDYTSLVQGSVRKFADGEIAAWFADGERVLADKNPEIYSPLKVYPNPVNTTLNVNLGDRIMEDTEVMLFNSSGTLLQTYFMPTGQVNLDISMQMFPPGIYYLKVLNGSGYGTRAVVKF